MQQEDFETAVLELREGFEKSVRFGEEIRDHDEAAAVAEERGAEVEGFVGIGPAGGAFEPVFQGGQAIHEVAAGAARGAVGTDGLIE